jgi:hypothetical protein
MRSLSFRDGFVSIDKDDLVSVSRSIIGYFFVRLYERDELAT